MRTVAAALDLDALIARYHAGETLAILAADQGVGTSTLSRWFRARGVEMRRAGLPIRHPGERELRRLYVDEGLTSGEIAALLGASRSAVSLWLQDAGIARTPSEARRLHAAHIGPERRRAQAEAAHAAVRGRRVPFDELRRRALGCEARQSGASDNDRVMADWLTARGFATTLIKAVGPYNVDVAACLPGISIAVELFGGGWHLGGRALARWPRRARYLLDAGWHLVVVWAESSGPLQEAAADYVAAFAAEAAANAATQYRVIRGTGVEMLRLDANARAFPVKTPR